MMKPIAALACLLMSIPLAAQDQLVPMPWPVHYFSLQIEGQQPRMAYMDIQPARSNGQTALLLHGKNFNGFYWRQVAVWLAGKGYRVIIPDQLGFGNSDYPHIHYSFHQLAMNTAILLDSLHIDRVALIGHSMGGMLATRFSLMFPARVTKLILEDPIGLEDYRTIVPYTTFDVQYDKELHAGYQSYQDYQKTYYPVWKPEYDTLVYIQALALRARNFNDIARANVLTYAMIYEQPVCYEFHRLRVPAMLIVGSEDRTVVGKAMLSKEEQAKWGNYPELGKKTAAAIPGAQLKVLPGIGHIPHIQDFDAFRRTAEPFLEK
jgi:pimeloyl-ACP methyl ester carboxylesterase